MKLSNFERGIKLTYRVYGDAPFQQGRVELGTTVEYPSIRHAKENFKTDYPEYSNYKNLHFVRA